MNWLAEWLKEIIFIVLIAVFVDLLLPNRAMERYVKLVVSLLILLTLISPVMRFLSSDAKKELETAFSESIEGLENEAAGQSTEAILRQGEELRQKQEAEALQWAGEETARQMKEQIERETGQPVERVSVKLTTKPAKTGADKEGASPPAAEPVISEVEVVMAEAKTESSDADSNASGRGPEITVAPIEKITVRVGANTNESSEQRPSSGANDPTTEAMAGSGGDTVERKRSGENGNLVNEAVPEMLVTQIEELLSKNWGVAENAVTIIRPQAEKS
ncbi:MAG: stage III sporulation protein AF [Paenibacillus macerans]|uniref:Stage III sporulation protein AF n=1 Tax=Paenibacillus macerans TaxID=44252 RepID=A0A091A009_PAEMA|nr:stage III sporulation protein AF [Paenibacillus macerans]KFN09646.1 stage III sporulation protein AF [Paenibacillus macerans]MBS5909331.1 stage III sporulation protein AF [Paenibacillus macerans]MDU7472003.1 stage III sporulation protein AF [Paenibacillus macerans]MEC0137022.1 stage III sporulation protein AF [Paenibacillus macerans]MEC0152904.1 stage III sporulation protein AF [Paenibacillus macerans]